MIVSATASAQTHSYGVVINGNVPAGDADRGMAALIATTTLNNVDCSNHVSHEIWYGLVPGAQFWVEVGFASGISQAGCVDKAVFWADNRNGGGYHEHWTGHSWSLGTTYQPWIGQAGGSCTWSVNFGGINIGTSTNNCPGTGRHLAGGIETTSTASASQVKGFLAGFLRADVTLTWQSGWDGPVLSQNSPPFIQWTDSSHTGSEEVLNVAF
jgi:hypothetical protein